ncbi:hypothetical protein NBRC116493_12780 [Aurantivibrio infirmus]
MDAQVIQHMALLMSVNCVRKTVLDDYVSDGRLTEEELQSLITEVTDKLYTFLTYLLDKSESEKQVFLEVMNSSYPHEWAQPIISEVFEEAVSIAKLQRESN